MRKIDELKGPSCLTNAADDEPLFVLRANDEAAPAIVRAWAAAYRVAKSPMTEAQRKKYNEALVLADLMEAWRAGKSYDEVMSRKPEGSGK